MININNYSDSTEKFEWRMLPIYSVKLTEEQKKKVVWDKISVAYLTKEQIKQIEDNLAFDEEIDRISSYANIKILNILKK